MTTHRIHKGNFTTVPNETIRDQRLSFQARGILAFVLSHEDGWHTSKDYFRSQTPAGRDGKDSLTRALRELETTGYRHVKRHQGDDGLWSTTVHWYSSPTAAEPADGNPAAGSPAPIQKNIQKNIQKDSSSSSSLRSSSSSSSVDEQELHDNGYCYCHPENLRHGNGNCYCHP